MERFNVTHWVSYGTLLGIARDGDIIPWTIDDDIVIKGIPSQIFI
jgi:phosphorylcholine metabolism protein LicD